MIVVINREEPGETVSLESLIYWDTAADEMNAVNVMWDSPDPMCYFDRDGIVKSFRGKGGCTVPLIERPRVGPMWLWSLACQAARENQHLIDVAPYEVDDLEVAIRIGANAIGCDEPGVLLSREIELGTIQSFAPASAALESAFIPLQYGIVYDPRRALGMGWNTTLALGAVLAPRPLRDSWSRSVLAERVCP
jgi:hypothetical protein